MDAMFSIIWILALVWLSVAFVNAWQMRSIERDWEDFLREHGASSRDRSQLAHPKIVKIRR
jgi:hypothetical protein